jgi:hypothetical protein
MQRSSAIRAQFPSDPVRHSVAPRLLVTPHPTTPDTDEPGCPDVLGAAPVTFWCCDRAVGVLGQSCKEIL